VSKNRRIAVFARSLHGPRPRGVQRVARAITEELVARLPSDVECYCLLSKVRRQDELTYEACDLRAWLARNPLTDREERGLFARLTRLVRRSLDEVLSPGARQFAKSLPALMRRIILRIPMASRLRAPWSKVRRLWGELRKDDALPQCITLDEIDVIISFDPFDRIWNEPTHRCRTRLISWFHDAIPKRINEGAHWDPDRFDSCVTNACYRAHRIICVSRSAEDDLLTFFPTAAGKTQVIYSGHDLERFARGIAASRPVVDDVLRKQGISTNRPYLFVLGAIEPRKNIAGILRACEVLRRHNPRLDFQVVFAGDLSGQPKLRQLLKRARRYFPVHMLRYIGDEDAAIVAGQAKAFLYPSLWEGFGIPMLEAMTAGALVVTSDTSSMPEVCGPHAIYCDPYDTRDMADKFLQCLTMDEEERRERTTAAQQHSSAFTWRKTANELLSVLEDQFAAGIGRERETANFGQERICA
jgi:glycosyltransferase involved in cell wall biosynthesis